MSSRNFEKVLMIFEAFFGSFFVAVVTGLFIPMLAYSGYPLNRVSLLSLVSALVSLLVAYAIYRYPGIVSHHARSLLLVTHALQRFIWMIMPYAIEVPELVTILYAIVNVIGIPVGILLNIALLDVFRSEEEYMSVIVWRTAAGSASSILGYLFTFYITMHIEPPHSYHIAYLTGGLVGFLSTLTLIPYRMTSRFEESVEAVREEVEIRKINTFIMLFLMMSAGNIVGLAWPQTIKSLGAPISIAIALNIAGALGSIIGPYMWRGYRSYVLAIAINAVSSILIPFIPVAYGHVALSFILSLGFVGANLIASSIYSKYVKSIGMVRASAFLVSASYAGLLTASIIGILISNYHIIYTLSTLLRLLALLEVLVAIPETAVTRPERVYEYARLVYTASITGYTLMIEALERALRLMVEIIALTILLAILIFLYRLVYILVQGV